MVRTWDWSRHSDLLEYVRDFVSSPELYWRVTGTGLVRHDRPIELKPLLAAIEQAQRTSIEEWWVMKQVPGAPGALMHTHNKWDTYIYYTDWSDSHIYGPDYDIMPKPGLLVYLPKGTEHAVEDSYAEEGADRYSCVFLAYAKEAWEEDLDQRDEEP